MRWSSKRILLTGAAGFIGSNLLRRLVNLNAEIVAVDNFSLGRRENIKFFNGEVFALDVSNRSFLKMVKMDFDFIFHFGAPCSVILFNKEPEEAFRETVSGFINIMELASQAQVKKVVYPSSGSCLRRCSSTSVRDRDSKTYKFVRSCKTNNGIRGKILP